MDDLADESGLQKSRRLLADEGLTFRGLPPHFLPDRPCARPHGETVLNHLPGDPGHIRRSPCEDVSVCPQEGDERVFLFAVQKTTDPCGLGRAVAQGNLLDRDLVACDYPLPRGGGAEVPSLSSPSSGLDAAARWSAHCSRQASATLRSP